MFKSTAEEAETVHRSRSQFVILNPGHNIKYLPYAFNEHGAIMAANIIRSPRAIQMSIFVIRAFVKMRTTLLDSRDLARKLAALEQELKGRLDLHEAAIVDVLQRIMRIIEPPPEPALPEDSPKTRIGFREESVPYRIRRKPVGF